MESIQLWYALISPSDESCIDQFESSSCYRNVLLLIHSMG